MIIIFYGSINISIPDGSLTAVVGLVGVGKSSLMSAILGEMEKISGRVSVKVTMAITASNGKKYYLGLAMPKYIFIEA